MNESTKKTYKTYFKILWHTPKYQISIESCKNLILKINEKLQIKTKVQMKCPAKLCMTNHAILHGLVVMAVDSQSEGPGFEYQSRQNSSLTLSLT
jgi:hypothetical protein